MKYTYYILLLLTFAACKEREPQFPTHMIQMDGLETYEAKQLSTLTYKLKDSTVFMPMNIWVQDTLLIVSTTQAEDSYLLNFYSLNSLEILKRFGQTGRGPGEFLIASVWGRNDKSLLITEKLRYCILNIDSLLQYDSYFPVRKNVQLGLSATNYACFLNDSVLLSYQAMTDYQFSLANLASNKYIFEYKNFPSIINNPRITDYIANSKVYRAIRSIKPNSLDTLAIIYRYFPVIDFVSLKDMHVKRIQFPINNKVNVMVLDKLNALVKDKRMYHIGCYGTDNYLYVLYSRSGLTEKTNDLEIHRYTWNGEFNKRYKINDYTLNFCVDEANNKIYAINLDDSKLFSTNLLIYDMDQ